MNNEKICCEISEDKTAVCEKTAGLRRGKFSDSNSACLKVLVPVQIFQFQDMLNESERYQDAANSLSTPVIIKRLDLEKSSSGTSYSFRCFSYSVGLLRGGVSDPVTNPPPFSSRLGTGNGVVREHLART